MVNTYKGYEQFASVSNRDIHVKYMDYFIPNKLDTLEITVAWRILKTLISETEFLPDPQNLSPKLKQNSVHKCYFSN